MGCDLGPLPLLVYIDGGGRFTRPSTTIQMIGYCISNPRTAFVTSGVSHVLLIAGIRKIFVF